MDVALFDYELPPERIAQEAADPRDGARLMVLDRAAGATAARGHAHVRDLGSYLRPGDLLVVNDTRVVPARIHGRKPSGGRVELFFVGPVPGGAGDEAWRVLIGASRAPREGTTIELPGGYAAEVLEAPDDEGAAVVRVRAPRAAGGRPEHGGEAPDCGGGVPALLAAHGLPPLPPYIRRAPGDPRGPADRERYQTVYARAEGALAAPTAGLHFTPALLERLAAQGVRRAPVTLHVGEGTFRPVKAADTGAITLHAERFDLPAATADAIAATRAAGGRVVAVGTTVVRTLESRPPRPDGAPEPGAGATSVFIAPGFAFRYVDALLTNFHLPKSTLLMLVAAFAGRERVLDAYAEAVREGYRFYSYGDAMLVL